MTWLWLLFGSLVALAGVRLRLRLRGGRTPTVDDEALRRILREGRLASAEEDDDEPLDMDAAARAEDEFWSEPWDEPDEYRP